MGGHDAGDLASGLVVAAFADLAGATDVTLGDVERRIRDAQRDVDALGASDRGAPGSTLVVAALSVVDGLPFWLIANVGDSRAYVWQGGALEQVSRDHSVVQELIDAGELDANQARHHPERHVITRAIGASEDAVAEFAMIPVVPGARLMLCSDGLTSEVNDEDVAAVLSSGGAPGAVVEALIDLALARGGHDNVTVVLVDIVGTGDVEDTLRRISDLDENTIRTALR